MQHQLVPSRRGLAGEDLIFSLNSEARIRAAQGQNVINSTLGVLLDDEGNLVILQTVRALLDELIPEEIAPYAPIAGESGYLTALVRRYWPDLDSLGIGCATPGGSGALSISARNFMDPGDALLTFAPYWSPYATIAAERGARIVAIPMPDPNRHWGGDAFKSEAERLLRMQGRLLIWLNDPCHNPTGLHLSPGNRNTIFQVLRELAHLGPITLLLDFAYLEYSAVRETVVAALMDYAAFAKETAAQHNVLVGAALSISKALTLYGARAGALVFPWCTDPLIQAALNTSCRGVFGNAPRAPQSLIARLAGNPSVQAQLKIEHRYWSDKLQARARALNDALEACGLPGITWQGGFFITIATRDSIRLSEHLKQRGVFVVPMPEGLRVGICGLHERHAGQVAIALKDSLASLCGKCP